MCVLLPLHDQCCNILLCRTDGSFSLPPWIVYGLLSKDSIAKYLKIIKFLKYAILLFQLNLIHCKLTTTILIFYYLCSAPWVPFQPALSTSVFDTNAQYMHSVYKARVPIHTGHKKVLAPIHIYTLPILWCMTVLILLVSQTRALGVTTVATIGGGAMCFAFVGSATQFMHDQGYTREWFKS